MLKPINNRHKEKVINLIYIIGSRLYSVYKKGAGIITVRKNNMLFFNKLVVIFIKIYCV